MSSEFRVPGSELTEAQVRELRDRVFEAPSTDKNWEACREKWMRPDSVQWLLDHAGKERA